jgi:hypothetical protein
MDKVRKPNISVIDYCLVHICWFLITLTRAGKYAEREIWALSACTIGLLKMSHMKFYFGPRIPQIIEVSQNHKSRFRENRHYILRPISRVPIFGARIFALRGTSLWWLNSQMPNLNTCPSNRSGSSEEQIHTERQMIIQKPQFLIQGCFETYRSDVI